VFGHGVSASTPAPGRIDITYRLCGGDHVGTATIEVAVGDVTSFVHAESGVYGLIWAAGRVAEVLDVPTPRVIVEAIDIVRPVVEAAR
jgi:hypothetical protein